MNYRSRVPDGAGPVGAVFNVGNVAHKPLGSVLGSRQMRALSSALNTVRDGGASKSGGSEENAAEEGDEDHVCE